MTSYTYDVQPSALRITTTTGTNYLTTTAPCSGHNNGGAEHGSFELHVSRLSWNAVVFLLELGAKDLTVWDLLTALPEHPHCMFRCARPFQHPSLPPDPTHHQLVIIWHLSFSLHPDVQNIQSQIWWYNYKINVWHGVPWVPSNYGHVYAWRCCSL